MLSTILIINHFCGKKQIAVIYYSFEQLNYIRLILFSFLFFVSTETNLVYSSILAVIHETLNNT